MYRESFLNRFLLSPAMRPLAQTHSTNKLKKAAVLIILVARKNGLHVILTERALHLRHHPGQVSFPGGKYEESDHCLKHTALRETEEEIGIQADLLDVIGQLPPLNTVSGFNVSPFVAFVDDHFTLNIDAQEVKSVFEVPLRFLLDSESFYRQRLIANKKRHFTYCIGYQNHLIWGATAQILKNLQLSLDHNHSAISL
jgi:8-oxo-dGTP pyrophosphatase MutT (NUDIX family)